MLKKDHIIELHEQGLPTRKIAELVYGPRTSVRAYESQKAYIYSAIRPPNQALKRANRKRWRDKIIMVSSTNGRTTYPIRKRTLQEVRNVYGLSDTELADLLERGQGGCHLCCTQFNLSDRYAFHTDHCHASGRVRGLLCAMCNRSIEWVARIEEPAGGRERIGEYLGKYLDACT